MAKRVTLTEKIKTLLQGRGVTDFEKVAVYECVAASTRPVSQKGSIYDQARMTPEMLRAMGTYLEQESVPLQLIHHQWELPEGQLLEAATFTEGFDTELNSLFYVQSESELAEKMDLGIIDEVSIGAVSKKACCSKCGFDYFESDKRKMQLVWDRTCDNEHTIGEDGCHLILDGIEKWSELSLVPKGASSKPKILPVDKQRLANDDSYRSLAASGVNPDMLTLHASVRLPEQSPSKDNDMEAKELLEKLSAAQLSLGEANGKTVLLESQLAAANVENESLKTQLEAAKTEPSEREATLSAQVDTLTSERDDVKTSNETMVTFLRESYVKAQALLGADVKEDPTLEEIMSVVKDARLALHQIPVGGASEGADQGDQGTQAPEMAFSSSAFRTK